MSYCLLYLFEGVDTPNKAFLLPFDYSPEGHHLGNIDHFLDYQLPMNKVKVKRLSTKIYFSKIPRNNLKIMLYLMLELNVFWFLKLAILKLN